jgi:hypothetical protein
MRKAMNNLLWGLYWGICGAVVYSFFALAIFLIGGARPFDVNHTTLWRTIGLYFELGLMVGLLLGFSRPLLRSRVGVIVVGFFCAFIVWTTGLVSLEGLEAFNHFDLVACLGLALVTGPACGLAARRRLS